MTVPLQPYGDGNTGVTAFAVLPRGMVVRFRGGEMYLYDEAHPGRHHLDRMQALARRGRGLTTYINQHVRDDHAGRFSEVQAAAVLA